LKLYQVSFSDINGGAARAAYRIHCALVADGIDSRMLVNVGASGDCSVQAPTSKFLKAFSQIRPQLVVPICKLLSTNNPIQHSPALLPSKWPNRINTSEVDLIHLHWVQHEMMSIADIGQIQKPIVWTLHDMWAFCGAEHIAWDLRWRDGYFKKNRPAHEKRFDLNRYTWLRKRRHWRRPMHIVCPSKWLADCASSSVLMKDWPVTVIPNTIPTDHWKPINQSLARSLLGLPQDRPILLFGAIRGGNSHHKGFDLLLAALELLKDDANLESLLLVVFGCMEPRFLPQHAFPMHYTGHLHDDLSLRALYSAANIMVVPSRQESFGQTASESHACGTPVVAFRTCGLIDIVDHQKTGYLAEPFDPKDLARGIKWIFDDCHRQRLLGNAARDKAEKLWNPTRVSGLYKEVYQNAINTWTEN